MRIVPIALVIALSPSLALAQSWTATNGTTKPLTSAPASNPPRVDSTPPRVGAPKPSATPSTGNRGLRYGEGAADAGPLEVRRNK